MAHRLAAIFTTALLFSLSLSLQADTRMHSFCVSEHAWEAAVDEATPAAGRNGDNCLVVWKDNRANPQPYHQGTYLLYGRRFDRSGNVLDETSFQIQDEPFVWNNEGLTLPSVGAVGRDYLVVWLTRFRHVAARRVLSSGTVVAEEIEIARTGTATGRPALASTRRGSLVAWTDRVNNNGDIYATLLDKNGEVSHVVPVAVDAGNAQFPIAASAGKDYLVVWRELVSIGKGTLRAALITQSGEVRYLDHFPAALASWATVASNGRNYFVAWQTGLAEHESNQFIACALNARGRNLKGQLLLATEEPQESLFGVLPSGRNFNVLWRQDPQAPDAALRALPVSAYGAIKGDPSPAVSETGWAGYGSATALGRSDLLVVLEQKTPDYYSNGYLSRVHGTVMTQAR